MIEGYVLTEEILGKGAFSVVISGTRKCDLQKVAIKTINRSKLASSRIGEDIIKKEVAILQKYTHPNILKLYDFIESTEYLYIVMEYIEGGDLFDRLQRRKSYSECIARDLCWQILQALKYLHDRNIVHRDLKPDNLVLTSRSDDISVKLIDFGFATELTEGGELTTFCGTPNYLAPEMLSPQPRYGKQVDMWSFGVILFILLGGYPPFYKSDNKGLNEKIKCCEYRFHKGYWERVSTMGKDLIQKLLVLNPAERLTADQALACPWFQAPYEQLGQELSECMKQLRSSHLRRMFRKWVYTISAALIFRMNKWTHRFVNNGTAMGPFNVAVDSLADEDSSIHCNKSIGNDYLVTDLHKAKKRKH